MRFLRALFLLLLFLALGAGCQKNEKAAEGAGAKQARDPSRIRVTPEILGAIKTAPVARVEMRDTYRIASQITLDQDRVARIGVPVPGRISEVRASLGQKVERGQVLALLHSTELATAQSVYLKSISQLNFHQRAVERARLLLSADVIGSAELQKRENDLASSESELRAAEDHLKILGMSPEAIQEVARTRAIKSVAPVTASLGGTVIERKVTQGQVVSPADVLFTVADLSRVWAAAEVPEQQIHLIRPGQEVKIEVPALARKDPLSARLIYIGDTVNPETRTVTVRTDLANPQGALKPAMLAAMLIQGPPIPRMAVPAPALVREGSGDFVLLQTAPDEFKLQPVKAGPEENGIRPVLEGLKEGDRIVVEGAFHLNNERKRQEGAS